MVIANGTPYSGFHSDPLYLKHAATTKLALTQLFMVGKERFIASSLTSINA
jgi:hypothetical protein